MKWVRFDRYGNEQTWYSDDEVEKLKAENEELQVKIKVLEEQLQEQTNERNRNIINRKKKIT